MLRPKLVALGGKYAEILAVYDEVTGNLVLAEPSSGTVLPVPLTTVTHSILLLPLLNLGPLGCPICPRESDQPPDWKEGDTGNLEDAS